MASVISKLNESNPDTVIEDSVEEEEEVALSTSRVILVILFFFGLMVVASYIGCLLGRSILFNCLVNT